MPARTRSKNTVHRSKPVPLARAVGQRVRQLRLERGWDFDAFTEQTGLGRGYVSELERGLVVPGLQTLARVAAALELTIGDLVVGDSKRERVFELMRDMSPADVSHLLAEAEQLARKKAGA